MQSSSTPCQRESLPLSRAGTVRRSMTANITGRSMTREELMPMMVEFCGMLKGDTVMDMPLTSTRLNTFAPVTYLGRTGITVIRPLVFFPEKDAVSASRRLRLPVLRANCPAAGHTKREDMRLLLQDFRKIVPDVETKFMKAIVDTHKYGMWDRMKLPPRQTGGIRLGEVDPLALPAIKSCMKCDGTSSDELQPDETAIEFTEQ